MGDRVEVEELLEVEDVGVHDSWAQGDWGGEDGAGSRGGGVGEGEKREKKYGRKTDERETGHSFSIQEALGF